jgi:endogenous inhibitor of DNA gyrase (YacG/DUF329 family)
MANPVHVGASETRSCPYCGKPVKAHLERCPSCREAMPQSHVAVRPLASKSRQMIRRGLMYMLLAGVVHYFAAGYSGMRLPVAIPSFVTAYLTPLIFLCGLGLGLYGFYLRAQR